jgi:hypothetical protein
MSQSSKRRTCGSNAAHSSGTASVRPLTVTASADFRDAQAQCGEGQRQHGERQRG